MHLSCILGILTFYTCAAFLAFCQYIFSKNRFGKLSTRVLVVGFLLHTALLFYYLASNPYPYFPSALYALHFVSWALILTCLLLARKLRLEAAGPFLIPTALFVYVFAIFKKEDYLLTQGISNPWTFIHFMSTFLAFTLFLLAFAIGIAFLVQERHLKRKEIPLPRLPSLEVMDEIHSKTLGVGWGLLTIGISAGTVLSHQIRGVWFVADPRQWGAILAWVFYFVVLKLRVRDGWRGRNAIFLSLLGFLAIVLTFLTTSHVIN